MRKIYLLSLLAFSFSFWANGQCSNTTAYETVDINNVSAPFMNGGDMFWNLSDSEYEVPQGSGNKPLFAGAIWMGGIDDDGTLKVAAQTYRQSGTDFWAGPLEGGDDPSPISCEYFDQIWKVNQSDIDAHIADFEDGTIDDVMPESIIKWPAKDNPNITADLPSGVSLEGLELAPFYDKNDDNIYNPTDGDYPLIKGDQAIWYIFNDNGGVHGESGGAPIGVQVSVLAYAIQDDTHLNDAVFIEYTIKNQSATALNDYYFGVWADPDLGEYTDDYVGCDPEQNLGYVYNGNGSDSVYGEEIPLVGIKILKGLDDEDGNDTGMSMFKYYNNNFDYNGNPEGPDDFYNYLKGAWKDSTLQLDNNGDPTQFMFAGNPSNADEWSECSENNPPSDRRFLMSTGPTNLQAGEEKIVVASILYLEDDAIVHPCPDVTPLSEVAAENQTYFEENLDWYGSQSESSGVRIEVLSVREDISIYPNPSKEDVFIELSNLINWELINVYDIQGKLVSQVPNPSNIINLNVVNLNSGIYVVEAITEKNQVIRDKMFIE